MRVGHGIAQHDDEEKRGPEADRLRLFEQINNEEPPPPRRHDKRIPRDLETIVLKATSKEPRQRYATAGELAQDLERYLREEPVRECRDFGARSSTLRQLAMIARHRGLDEDAIHAVLAPLAPPRLSVPRKLAAAAHAVRTSWGTDSPDSRIVLLRAATSPSEIRS